MDLNNAEGLADRSVPPYETISTSECEYSGKVLPIAQEDEDLIKAKNKLNEDASPSTERKANKPSMQISTVPSANNLFELLIKRVESANASEKADICRQEQTTNTMDDVRPELQESCLERESLVNGVRSAVITSSGTSSLPNGEASTEQNEISSSENISNKSNNNRSPGRSIFEHLRKNFRLPDEKVPTATDKLSTSAENNPRLTIEVEITSSTEDTELTSTASYQDVTKATKGTDYHQGPNISVTHSIYHNELDSDDMIVIESDESQAPAGQNSETVHDDNNVFPFTHRLKWMSQRSREGSPSLPQQPSTEQSNNGTCYHSNPKGANEMSSEPVTSGLNSNLPGFQPLLGVGQSGTSNSGPVSVRLHNGTLTTSLNNATFAPVQIPKKDMYLVVDPPTRFIEENTNFRERTPTQQNRGFLPATQRFLNQTSVQQSAAFPVTSGFVHGIRQSVPKENSRHFLSETNHSLKAKSDQNIQFGRAHLHRNAGESLSLVLHTEQSQAFSSMWERRPIVTSSTPINHRVPASLPFSYNNTTSAFSSPNFHQQRSAHGNPVMLACPRTHEYDLPRSSFQPLRLEVRSRQELKFTNAHYYSTSTSIAQNPVSCNESFPKSPEHFSISDRVFRPVSPTWSHPLYSRSRPLVTSQPDLPVKVKPTVSDADKDAFSYACALHESANSPDIERMLGSESPVETSSLTSPPLSIESPTTKSTIKTTSAISALRFTDSGSVRDSTSLSDFSPTAVRSSGVSTVYKENSVDTMASLRHQNAEENLSLPDKNYMDSSNDSKKKKKMNLSVIHKRLEPKLPSPVREISSGDLYQDPSKLTREERALQRAMMIFSEMEMKNKEVPSTLPKKKRVHEVDVDEPEKCKEPITKTVEKKLASSTWILNVKRKQKHWLSQRKKIFKKSSASNPDVKTEPSTDGIGVQTFVDDDVTEEKKKTKIKKRKILKGIPRASDKPNDERALGTRMSSQVKAAPESMLTNQNARTISPDDCHHNRISNKKKKFMNEAKKNLTKEVVKATDVEVEIVEEPNLSEQTAEDILRKKKKKAKRLKLRKRLEEKHGKTKHFKEDQTKHLSTVTSGHQELPTTEVSSVERKRSLDERHRVKTYMLVPSYQGFKDFQPVVIESRTRRKKVTQPSASVKPNIKPTVPLLVIESVNSKPVKEMVVAENEEVQKLVTECLRVHGKWHGDELEQALKREEAELNDEVTRFRDAKKLSVNRTTGETILHKAARLGYDEIVKQCILQGADPNAKDNAGWTPLHEACARGKLAVVKVLARYGADVNSQSNDGIRPVHDAAEAGHIEVIRVLLSYGADPFLVTYAGLNALACAKHPRAKKFIQEYCVDIGHQIPQVTPQGEAFQDGWQFSGSSSILDEHDRPERVSGIWDGIPDCAEIFFPEFEISDRPHLNTYNLPVIKDGVIVGRRNYLLLQELYDNGYVAKTTLQKKLRNVDLLELPWAEFLDTLSESHVYVKPTCTPEGTSTVEPKAQLIPLNYTIRRLLGIRMETCRC